MSDIETLRTARSDAQSHPQAVADTLSDPLAGQSLRDPLQAAGGSAFPERAAGIASQATAGSGSALPMLGQIQSSFGKHDVSGVRAHQGAGADAANRQMGSRAFATGSDVVLGNSGSDLHTVAHEAAHVVQQRGGVQLAGGWDRLGMHTRNTPIRSPMRSSPDEAPRDCWMRRPAVGAAPVVSRWPVTTAACCPTTTR